MGGAQRSLKHSGNYLIENRSLASPIFVLFSLSEVSVKRSTGFAVELEN